MFLIDNLTNILKNIFFINLLAIKKNHNNLANKFNNIKEYIINFVDKKIIKIII